MDTSKTILHNIDESSTMRRRNFEGINLHNSGSPTKFRNSDAIPKSFRNSTSPARLRDTEVLLVAEPNELLAKRAICVSIELLGLEPQDYGFSNRDSIIWPESLHRNIDNFVTQMRRTTSDLDSVKSVIQKMKKTLSKESGYEIFDKIWTELDEIVPSFWEVLSTDVSKQRQDMVRWDHDTVNTPTVETMAIMFMFMRFYRSLYSLLMLNVDQPTLSTFALSKWLCKLVHRICIKINGKARKADFKQASKWVTYLEDLEDKLELVDLAILISLPQTELLRNVIDETHRGRPSMVAHLFEWMDQDQFLAQLQRAWTNPWTGLERQQLAKICKLAGRSIVNDQIVSWLGRIYGRILCEIGAEEHASAIHPKQTKMLHLRVYEELHDRLQEDATEYDEVVAMVPKLGEQRSNVLRYLEKCIKLMKKATKSIQSEGVVATN